jgi:FKBP-type peptidyl-prolyl cis-trans isomerase
MKKLSIKEWISVVTTITVVGVIGYSTLFTLNNGTGKPASLQPETQQQNMQLENISTTKGLEVYDVKVGDGAEAVSGKIVSVHYTGILTDGKKFDSSVDRGQPFQFPLGAGQVIRGWDLGVAGMKVGGVRRLVIAPELGYGANAVGNGLIPANSTLIFEVQLLGVQG